MTMRMLIDARHPEETRVAVVKGNRVEEFDFEAAAKKQIKGNIYLAKVTRVEPSLQAAFIEYGGNRHGFLAFSEIHPDYYQIPREDREALLREEEELDREEMEYVQAEELDDENGEDAADSGNGGYADETADPAEDADSADEDAAEAAPPRPVRAETRHDDHHHERMRERRMALRRRYKIQDVIKRRQVLLVQVVKEERGNKGAALTTYLSLAGRYCVLMPNTSHGGGISRKISSQADRKRLKSIMEELKLPSGMACIVRTAGLSRTKTEIKRDFDYLTRLWDDIRELTLQSAAPALIHEDSDLIKRAIRDIYTREIEEILIEGDEGYAQARQFMKLLMPSHVKKVKHYIDPVPLFQRAQIEGQLNAMFHPVVQLRSGGYLVINPTEALVSIDINSGRSTREHNIEETALKTNMEAADEIARQLRLRDMAGLIVVDFIDMEHGGNVRKVERQMKEALKNDRARIQVGRISSFGLMEMSRQRLRTGVLEASSVHCPMCEGAGIVRSASSAALSALRTLEEEAVRGRHSLLTLRAANEVAVYVLNRKRAEIAEIEERYGVQLDILPDGSLLAPRFTIEGAGGPPVRPELPARPARTAAIPEPEEFEEEEPEDEIEEDVEEAEAEEERREPRSGRRDDRREERGDGERRGRRRRRRGRRGGSDDTPASEREPIAAAAPADPDSAPAAEDSGEEQPSGRRRRRRRRRGGRNLNGAAQPEIMAGGDEDAEDEQQDGEDALIVADALLSAATELDAPILAHAPADEAEADAAEEEPAPKAKRSRSRKKAAAEDEPAAAPDPAPAEPAEASAEAKPKRRRARKKAEPAEAVEAPAAPETIEPAAAAPEPEDAPAPARKPRTRRKAAAADAMTGIAAEATAALQPESVAAPAPAGEDPAAAEDASGTSAEPRRGWWQRTFGG